MPEEPVVIVVWAFLSFVWLVIVLSARRNFVKSHTDIENVVGDIFDVIIICVGSCIIFGVVYGGYWFVSWLVNL